MQEDYDGEPEGYSPSDDSPEARLYREDERRLSELLNSLKPEDAHRHLFTWMEIITWKLKNGRFRRRIR